MIISFKTDTVLLPDVFFCMVLVLLEVLVGTWLLKVCSAETGSGMLFSTPENELSFLVLLGRLEGLSLFVGVVVLLRGGGGGGGCCSFVSG